MTPRVHVIYVRGTVQQLLPFLLTLLRHTDWRFNLASNGCDANEWAKLEEVRQNHPHRISSIKVSAHEVLAHGEVLDQLLQTETEDHFCFLDSDILATSAVGAVAFLPGPGEVASCACLPLWHGEQDAKMPGHFDIAAGRFLETQDGQFLGCTYAAAYRVADLRDTLTRWRISLRKYQWEDLPVPVQRELDRRGLRCQLFDTAKVANVLLQRPGAVMTYREIPQFLHVGALSGAALARQRARTRRLPFLRRVVRRVRRQASARGPRGAEELASVTDLRRRRAEAGDFVDRLARGEATFNDAPAWLAEQSDYDALAALFATQAPANATP